MQLFPQTQCFFTCTSFSFFTFSNINLTIVTTSLEIIAVIISFHGNSPRKVCFSFFFWLLRCEMWLNFVCMDRDHTPNIYLGSTHLRRGLVIPFNVAGKEGPGNLILIERPSCLRDYGHHSHDMCSAWCLFLLKPNLLLCYMK